MPRAGAAAEYKRTCLLVLAMHRSGTSALTRVLSLVGAELPKVVLGSGPGNETGHWEPQRLVDLNDQMLAEAHSRFDDWRAFDPAELGHEKREHFKSEIKRVITEEFPSARLFVLKDPRVCRFVPFYEEAFAELGVDLRFILMHRNPLAVAASLEKRNGMTRGFSDLLWLRHVLDAERATRNKTRAFVSYETFLSGWRAEIDRLAVELSMSWPRKVEDAAGEVEAFLSKELRHHAPTAADLEAHPTAASWVKAAYAALTLLEENTNSVAALNALEAVRMEFEAPAAVFGRATFPELALYEKRLIDQSAQLDSFRADPANRSLVTSLLQHEESRPWAERKLDSLRRLVSPIRLPTNTQLPANQIEPNGIAHGWRSTGTDPQLIIPTPCQSRTIRVLFSAHIINCPETPSSHKWQLFYDTGSGFSEEDSITQSFSGSEIVIDKTILLPSFVIRFRLDPVNIPCEFIVEHFEITAVSRVRARLDIVASKIAKHAREGRLLRSAGIAAKMILRGESRLLKHFLLKEEASETLSYQRWVHSRNVTGRRHAQFVAKGQVLSYKPLFSILMPTYNSPKEHLERAVQSVVQQTYPHWQLCIVDDGSLASGMRPTLERLSRLDSRIQVQFLDQNRGISAASNAALDIATGEYVALLDHDDELQPHALYAFAAAINRQPDADWLYSDEDKIDVGGRRFGPFFKPDWSPAYFLSCMYTCHLGVYRRSMVESLGRFRPEFDMAQDYDLALRFASATTKIVHIPDVLYHWRTLPQSTASGGSAKPEAEIRARKAVQSFIDRGKYPGTAVPGPLPGTHRVRFDIVGTPLVSIVIPSAGLATQVEDRHTWFVLELLRSIREKTAYHNTEIIVADNDDFSPELRAAITPLGVRLIHYASRQFNLAEKMNMLVEAAAGEYVILLNDDMTVITPGWITEMLMWCQQEHVAGVGAKLLFPNETIQHAGVLLLKQGPSHAYYLHDKSEIGQVCSAIVPREYGATTGACMMVRRQDYLAVGGFDPSFRVNYNDVDFCLKLRGYRNGTIIVTPYAQLFHYEAVSKVTPAESELWRFNSKWSSKIGNDPFYNWHLSPVSNCFEIDPVIRSLELDYDLPDAVRPAFVVDGHDA